eukprot:UN02885
MKFKTMPRKKREVNYCETSESEEEESKSDSVEEEESSLEEEESESEDKNDDICFFCNKEASQRSYVCSNCPRTFHLGCKPDQGKYKNKYTIRQIETKHGFEVCSDLGFACASRKKRKLMDDEIEFAWSSKCKREMRKTKKYEGGIVWWYYDWVEVNGVRFQSGDSVSLCSEGKENLFGYIFGIYKTDTQHFNKDTDDGYMTILWYWQQHDVPKNKRTHEDELFIGTYSDIDEQSLATINEKIIVAKTKGEYNRMNNQEQEHPVYFCGKKYVNESKKTTKVKGAYTKYCAGLKRKRTTATRIKPGKKNQKSKKTKEGTISDACDKLQLSHVPDILPCRDTEYKFLKKFLKGAIVKDGYGSGLYISGMPGTGKTATVRWVIRELEELKQQGKFPQFTYLEINAMKLQRPMHAYSHLYYHYRKKHLGWNAALNKLEQMFTTPDPERTVCVILIDELDYFVTRKQKVIYNFFDWPSRAHTKMIVLGIANTMDLPERLTPRVQSRIGRQHLAFEPYSKKQIITILEERLKALNCFEQEAISFCAAKAASQTGDIRRALQICKRAAEIRERKLENKGEDAKVTREDVQLAVKTLFSSSLHETIQELPLYPRAILASCARVQKNYNKMLTFENVWNDFMTICRQRGIPTLNEDIIEQQCDSLANLHLIEKIKLRMILLLFKFD